MIRQKITGRADKALNSRNVPNDWVQIRAALVEHFADHRDLATFQQQIPYLVQGSKSLDEYYHETLELQAKISAKITLSPEYAGHVQAVVNFSSQSIKHAFIDGLRRPYAAYTRNANPENLAQAFQIAKQKVLADKRSRDK